MAKLGEGDPRWKVEERADGKNVNAWHWTEKNCFPWAENKLKELLKDLSLGSTGASVTAVEKLTGDCTYCNRKRKNIFLYDIDLSLTWKIKNEDNESTGKISVNIEQDSDYSSLPVSASVTKAGSIPNLRESINREAVPIVRKVLKDFHDQLVATFSEDFSKVEIIPMKPVEPVKADSIPELRESLKLATSTPVPTPSNPNEKKKLSTKIIRQKIQFQAPARELYECLVDQRRLCAFTQSECNFKPEVGSEFSIFSGQIVGKNEELEVGKKIVQKWRFKDWPEGHYSTVTILIEDASGGAILSLKQTGVPTDDADRTLAGWRSHFWDRLRMTFNFPYTEL